MPKLSSVKDLDKFIEEKLLKKEQPKQSGVLERLRKIAETKRRL